MRGPIKRRADRFSRIEENNNLIERDREFERTGSRIRGRLLSNIFGAPNK